MKSVIIVGYGVVGHNLHEEIGRLIPDVYDVKFGFMTLTKKEHYDFAFICVDTPYIDEANVCDLTQVRNAIEETNADIYIIKSTILPGTTKQLMQEFEVKSYREYNSDSHKKHIVFSPEYYGGTQHCNNFDFNFTILGGEKEDCLKVQQLLQDVYDARHTFHIVDSTTAELAKYMENCWLATKVSFCGAFWNIANKCDVDYETLRELFILDPRVNASHTYVYDDKPYWQSHCLDKDVKALATASDNTLLKSIIQFNESMKKTSK